MGIVPRSFRGLGKKGAEDKDEVGTNDSDEI